MEVPRLLGWIVRKRTHSIHRRRPAGQGRQTMKRISPALILVIPLFAVPARAQYAVKLSWTASSTAAANPSLTYNVYRASTCAAPFSRINSAPVIATVYVDSSAGSGAAYCYQVTAVLAGVESSPSNQAIAAVPPPSDRQAVCSHRGPIVGWLRCLGARPKRQNPGSTATP
jgi:hypothetical protein